MLRVITFYCIAAARDKIFGGAASYYNLKSSKAKLKLQYDSGRNMHLKNV